MLTKAKISSTCVLIIFAALQLCCDEVAKLSLTTRQQEVEDSYLIFVTDTRTVSVEKKSVMWRNFKFLYMTDEEKSKISPHVD